MTNAITGLLSGFAGMFDWALLLALLFGGFIGVLFGALPGMNGGTASAIFLPIAFSMRPDCGLVMLCAMYYGSMYGGSITAILINIPGTSQAMFTAIEGYPMAKRGEGGYALRIAIWASFIGGTATVILLTFFAPELAVQALKFGSAERFAFVLLAFFFLVGLSGTSICKNLMAIVFGLLIACVGRDSVLGLERLTFGIPAISDGVNFIIAILGIFAIAQVMLEVGKKVDEKDEISDKKLRYILSESSKKRKKRFLVPSLMRGTLIGFIVGMLPGAGATIATAISYTVEKKVSKHPEKFGQGVPEAIAAVEAANNASSSGALVPLLGLAIPGSATTAILLTAFLMYGLQPGPMLFTNNPHIVWNLLASMYAGNIIIVIMCLLGIPLFVWMVKKSQPFLMAFIFTISVAGAYSLNGWTHDIWTMVVCALIGFFMIILDFPVISVLLGLVLGSMMEGNFVTAILLGGGRYTVFFERPISRWALIIGIIVLFYPFLSTKFKKHKNKGTSSDKKL